MHYSLRFRSWPGWFSMRIRTSILRNAPIRLGYRLLADELTEDQRLYELFRCSFPEISLSMRTTSISPPNWLRRRRRSTNKPNCGRSYLVPGFCRSTYTYRLQGMNKFWTSVLSVVHHPMSAVTGAVISLSSVLGIVTTAQSAMAQIAHSPSLSAKITTAASTTENYLGAAVVIGTALATIGQSIIRPKAIIVVPEAPNVAP